MMTRKSVPKLIAAPFREKMTELAGGRLYQPRMYTLSLISFCSALKDMKHFLSDKWTNTEVVFHGVFKDRSDKEEFDNNTSDNEANMNRAECQYAAFLRYLRERNISEIHWEFLEWLRGKVEVGRHPSVQCTFRNGVTSGQVFRFHHN